MTLLHMENSSFNTVILRDSSCGLVIKVSQQVGKGEAAFQGGAVL